MAMCVTVLQIIWLSSVDIFWAKRSHFFCDFVWMSFIYGLFNRSMYHSRLLLGQLFLTDLSYFITHLSNFDESLSCYKTVTPSLMLWAYSFYIQLFSKLLQSTL